MVEAMAYDPERYRRHPMRAANFDYASSAKYFVTICCKNRAKLFGNVIDSNVQLNDAGKMVETVWKQLPNRFSFIELDVFVVMPNHLHGIVGLRDVSYGNETHSHVPGTPAGSLGRIVQAFKSLTTRDYIRGVKSYDWPPFEGRLWQRSYHDHIIRDDPGLGRIRTYISANPANWHQDQENPDRPDAAVL